jgi:hypothetical protein
MLALADSSPATAQQLLTLVQRHVANLNAAVQHLPYAPRWSVSTAVRRSARQLVQLLQDATASGYQDSASSSCQASSQQPGSQDCTSSQAGGLTDAVGQVNGHASHASAAAAGLGRQSAAAVVGPSVMVGGRLVTAGVLQQGGGNGAGQMLGAGQMPRRRRRQDGEHRAKLIKKFSAKTQVRD